MPGLTKLKLVRIERERPQIAVAIEAHIDPTRFNRIENANGAVDVADHRRKSLTVPASPPPRDGRVRHLGDTVAPQRHQGRRAV
jgi:hypothetical protein